MSTFDLLLDNVLQLARQNADFLPNFARACEDRERVEKLLSLQEFQSLQAIEAFSRKCEVRAKLLLDSGELNGAIRTADSGSELLAKAYMARCRALAAKKHVDDALDDAKRALALPLPERDAVQLLRTTAECHLELGATKKGEEELKEALNRLKNSDLQNEAKASLAGDIVSKLKNINHKKQRRIQKKPVASALPELSYGRNSRFPAASDALRLSQTPERGRCLMAARDIKLGAVLILERPHAWTLNLASLADHCLHCCAYVMAPTPCHHCATVSFCSEECREAAWNAYHRLECSILNHILESKMLSQMAWLVYRIVATAITSGNFRSISEECPNPFASDDYCTVWGQVTNSSSRKPADLLKRTTSAIFLAHLFQYVAPGHTDLASVSAMMLRHLQSCSCNAYQITEQVVLDGNVRKSAEKELGGAVYPTISLVNHSCNPNIARHSTGRVCVVRAIKNIKKGEEILDNYGPHFLSNPRNERRLELKNQYFFDCVCEACFHNWPTLDKLDSIETFYKCVHCSANIGTSLSEVKVCLQCKRKYDYNKVAKKLHTLSRQYTKDLDSLLQRKYSACINTFIDYGTLMDSVLVHPNKQFVSCQQAITLTWSLMGNVQDL